MDDREVVQHIDELVAEENRLRDHSTAGHPLTGRRPERLGQLEVQLDQMWDLLRRRKATRRVQRESGRRDCPSTGRRRELPAIGTSRPSAVTRPVPRPSIRGGGPEPAGRSD